MLSNIRNLEESAARVWNGSSAPADKENNDTAGVSVSLFLLTNLLGLSLVVVIRKLSFDFSCNLRLLSSACFTACDRARRLVI